MIVLTVQVSTPQVLCFQTFITPSPLHPTPPNIVIGLYWFSVCIPIELLSTYFNLPQPSVMLIQCVFPQSYCQPTSTCLNPVWYWSSVCPHRVIFNLPQPASTQCGVGPMCVPIELVSTYFNLPQPSVVLVQCVSPLSYCQPTSTCLNPV